MLDHGPAVKDRCTGHENPEFNYPARFQGRVPKTVLVKGNVRSSMFARPPGQELRAKSGFEYPAWTNRHGAVSAILPCGEKLGLMPYEYEVTEWLTELSPKEGY